MSVFLFYLVIGIILVILAVTSKSLLVICVVCCCLIYGGILIKKRFKRQYVFLFFGCCLLFGGYVQLYNVALSIDETIQIKQKTGYIVEAKETESLMKYTVLVEHSLLKHETITIFQEKTEQMDSRKIGETVAVSCKLEPIASEDNFLLFNYKQYATSIGLYHQCFIKNLPLKQGISFITIPLKIKAKLTNYFQQFPEIIIPYLHAFILGDTSYFGEKQQIFVEIGIAHILALSSSQLQFFKKIFFFLGRNLRLSKERIILFFLLFLCLYTSMLHNNISFLRAVIAAFCLQVIEDVLARKVNKQEKLLVLSGTALFFLILNPYVIYNLGFQYTFLCSLFLQVYGGKSQKAGTLSKVSQQIKTNIACVLITLPITAYAQQEVSILPLLSTLLFSPMFTVIIGCSWLICVFPVLISVSLPIFYWIEQLFFLTNTLNQFHFFPLYFQLEVYLLLILLIVLLDSYYRKKWKQRMIISIIVMSYILSIYSVNTALSSIHFLSLPYGEMTIIDIGGIVYMIDTGGSRKEKDNIHIVQKIILPFLKKINIQQIDVLILTHDDIDHTGAAKELLKNINVATIYLSFQSEEEPEYQAIIEAEQKMTTIIRVEQQITLQHLVLLPIILTSENNNNTSLVAYGLFGGKKWLFLGDLEKDGEIKLVKQFPSLKADVLKIGHHGSRTSTSEYLLQKLQPKYGIINVQTKNIYNHPHLEVVERLDAYNIQYWITNKDGSQSYFFLGPFSFFRH